MLNSLNLKKIAAIINGELKGDPETLIVGINAIDTAKKGDISFVYQKKYASKIKESSASAFIVQKDIELPENLPNNYIIVQNARFAMNQLARHMFPPRKISEDISPKAHISETAKLGSEVTIYPQVYIGDRTTIGNRVTVYPGVYIGDDVSIDDDTVIYANSSICDRSGIGKRCIISANVVIGSDGFGYLQVEKKHQKIHHIGHVVINDDVEVGAGTMIDRGTYHITKIEKGTKIDNLVHIGHNTEIGENSLICGQCGTSGSSKIGDNCIMLGKSGVGPQVTMHDDTLLYQSSLLIHDNEKGGGWRGEIARPIKEYLKANAGIYYIEKLRERVKKLEKKLAQMEE